MKLKLAIEVNKSFMEANTTVPLANTVVLVTPPLDENYFIARVPLYKEQAIVIFPKFGLIGCGFAQESDWNTNLPIKCKAEEIWNHIKHNKKHKEITKEAGIVAIKMLQEWVNHYQKKGCRMIRELEKPHPDVIRRTEVETDSGNFIVSTVELHVPDDMLEKAIVNLSSVFGGYATEGFETMIFPFGDTHDLYALKYDAREKAEAGHQKTIDDLLAGKIVLRERDKRSTVYENEVQ